MTSTNTYTHSNYYLSLVCNIALDNKYTRCYFNIISRALERPRNRTDAKALLGYVEGHHILPTSFRRGVNKDKENIVFLTSRKHFIIHAILVKMFVDVYRMKMINAFLRMKTIGNKDLPNRYYNSHLFSYYRKYFSERASKHFMGNTTAAKRLHCYNPTTFKRTRIKSIDDLPEGWLLGCPLNTKGMISIYNLETKETRRIRPNEKIPEGWSKGNYSNRGNKARLGMSTRSETKTKISEANKGRVYWNNGIRNIMTHTDPGAGWVKGKLVNYTKWWNNGIHEKMSNCSPDTGYTSGRLPKKSV